MKVFIDIGYPAYVQIFKKFFPILIIVWFLMTIFSKKFNKLEKTDYFSLFKSYIISILALTSYNGIKILA